MLVTKSEHWRELFKSEILIIALKQPQEAFLIKNQIPIVSSSPFTFYKWFLPIDVKRNSNSN